MIDLNDMAKKMLEVAKIRDPATNQMRMLKHCATEVAEATAVYASTTCCDDISRPVCDEGFASELADIISCALIISALHNLDINAALQKCYRKNVERAKSKPIDVIDEMALWQEVSKREFRKELEKHKNCGNCIYYLTKDRNEDKCTEYHHDRTKDRGICALYDQLRGIPKTEGGCRKWRYDNEQ